MKKTYVKPEVEIINLQSVEDISNGNVLPGTGDSSGILPIIPALIAEEDGLLD